MHCALGSQTTSPQGSPTPVSPLSAPALFAAGLFAAGLFAAGLLAAGLLAGVFSGLTAIGRAIGAH